jgi:hypothetical protein
VGWRRHQRCRGSGHAATAASAAWRLRRRERWRRRVASATEAAALRRNGDGLAAMAGEGGEAECCALPGPRGPARTATRLLFFLSVGLA